MNNKAIHENYHTQTKKQTRTIREDDFTYRILLRIINANISNSKRKILDVGCGAGTLSLYLASKGHEVVGIDISQKAIRGCLGSKKELGLSNSNFKQLNFPNEYPKEKFDVVIFTEVIEHLEDDTKALTIINRLLKPKGIMILSTPSDRAPLHRLGLTRDFDKKVGHVRRYSEDEIVYLIKKNGFRINKIYNKEGIIRNFLFVNSLAGKFIRFIKFFISDLVTLIDDASIPIFGYSDIIIIARKNEKN